MTETKIGKTGKPRLSEADVTKQVRDMLTAEGWRGHRANRHSHLSPVAVPLITELGRHRSVAQRLCRGLSMLRAEHEPEQYDHDRHLHPLG